MGKFIDLTGKTFGELSVVSREDNRSGAAHWLCICACGKTKVIKGSSLRSGATKTCGHNSIKIRDLAGETCGRLLVVDRAENSKNRSVMYNCICSCGNKKIVSARNLAGGVTKSCGCISREFEDLTDNTYGRLLVISPADKLNGKIMFNCRCSCGNTLIVTSGNLKNGHTQSCGCYMADLTTTHGLSNTLSYAVWSSMKARCDNPNNPYYKNYGGRGITVCDRWNKFENFYDDMCPRPEGMTLERIDNDKGYGPDNCKWVTLFEQQCNKRTNRKIIGVTSQAAGNYRWDTTKDGQHYYGLCKTELEAATEYDNKCEEIHNYRPNGTEKK